jgi:hypothetical protein
MHLRQDAHKTRVIPRAGDLHLPCVKYGQLSELFCSDVALSTCLPSRRGAPRLQVEVARASVGVDNEHFLHHRRRGRGNHSCRLLGSASLNKVGQPSSPDDPQPAGEARSKFASAIVLGRFTWRLDTVCCLGQ